MSLSSPRADLHPPCISRTFTLPVAGSTILADSNPSDLAVPNGAPGGNAGINHLPATLFLVVGTTGTFIFTDVYANSNTVTLLAGAYTLPFTARTVEIGTAIGTLTASWQPGA